MKKLHSLKIIILFSILCLISFNTTTKAESSDTIYSFNYTGSVQEWTAPTDGIYKFETWGAEGGWRGNENSGKGGYTTGLLYAQKGDKFYIYVGGSGQTHQGYNGGGARNAFNLYGGGATDIRFDTDSLYSRVIVAGGGGTDGADGNSGGAGGLTGGGTSGGCGNGGNGASITGSGSNRGTFGVGGTGNNWAGGYGGAGGGGWYGGGGADPDSSGDDDKGGGGGSSFTWNDGTTSNVPTGYTVPSRLKMTNFSYSSGTQSGDGKAVITTVAPDGIASVKLNNGSVNINYDYKVTNYTITVPNETSMVSFNVTPKEGYSIIYSSKNLDLSSTTGTEIITVTHNATGISKTYTVTINQFNHYLKENADGSVYYDIPYTGQYQEFYIPTSGLWTTELWGAKGASRGPTGGNGGYTSADVNLSEGQKLYLYVGGSGSTSYDGVHRGWNGGGNAYYYYSTGGFYNVPTSAYGGGASDIRIGGQTLNNRLVVASGGGSAGARGAGGAGGVVGGSGCGTPGSPGGLNAGGYYGGTFGVGSSETIKDGGYTGAGGGGWYGGGRAIPDGSGDDDGGAGGGSGWVWQESYAKYAPADYAVSDKFYMTNGFIHTGNESFKNPNGGTETGHAGDGFIRLTPKLLNGVVSVTVNDGSIPIDFDFQKYNYNITVSDSTKFIKVNTIFDSGFTFEESYSGSYDFSNVNTKEYKYTFSVTNKATKLKTSYSITFRKASYYWQAGTTGSYGYSCTKDVQEFIAPASGIYSIETWGAQGSSRGPTGGNGSYASGNIFLNKDQIIYLYVGCSGNNGGYNGGGDPYSYRDVNQNLVIPLNLAGGGATDVRLGGKSLNNRIIVAGGGGGAGASGTGGPGDAAGNNAGCGSQGTAATMSSGGVNNGTWGKGGTQNFVSGGYAGAGGGGWYGGGVGVPDGSGDDDKGGGGGSSYIWSSNYAQYAPSDYNVSTVHYLTNPVIKNGYSVMPTHDGTSTMTGNTGDGYIRINFALSYKYKINVSDNVTLDKAFDYDTKNYVGTVANTSSTVTFNVDTTDDASVLLYSNDGTHEIHVGDNTYPISITYVNGAVDIFNYSIHREANDINYLNDLKINNESLDKYGSQVFSKDTSDYNVTLPYTADEYDLNVGKGSADQKIEIYSSKDPNTKFEVVDGIAHITSKENAYDLVVHVTNETNTSDSTYTLHVSLPHSSKMEKLSLVSGTGKKFEYELEEGKTTYDIELESFVASAKAFPELYDGEATSTVENDGYIKSDKYQIIITVSEPHVASTTYLFNVSRVSISGYENNVDYTGACVSYTVPVTHQYLLEVWGAEGGNGGGRGGYSSGYANLEKGTLLYLCAGGSGNSGGFNGGGTSRAGYGGGASDIRVGSNSPYARILIAGGGGGHGSDGCAAGGAGGGTNGGGQYGEGSCGTSAGGGTQSAGGNYGSTSGNNGVSGKFVQGANAPNSGGGYYGGGGGGGFYGGGSGATAGWSSGGGGGSGFIYDEESYKIVTDALSDTFGGSKWLVSKDYLLTNAKTLIGTESFNNVSHTGVESGHSGNGNVKISIPYQASENNYLSGIVSNHGTMSPSDWDYNLTEYDLYLDVSSTNINIEGVPADDKAKVSGNGNYIIKAGVTDINLTVTAETGDVRVYTLHVHRDVDPNPYPNTVNVDGMLSTYCTNDSYCKYKFNKDINNYNITVPYQIREINLTVDKGSYFQTVVGDGIYELNGGVNQHVVNITAEDNIHSSTYTYNVTRDMTGNADLKSLKVTNPETILNYGYDVTDYYITVPNATDHIEIEALQDDPKATVEVTNPTTLEYGNNNTVITVTAENGAKKIYTIHTLRVKSDNDFLATLSVTNITDDKNVLETLTPEFSKGTTNYTLKVLNDVTKIRIAATPDNATLATVSGTGDFDLNVGSNSFNVLVTAQDGSTLTYTITVNRAANSNAYLTDLKVIDVNKNNLAFTDAFSKDKFVYYIYTDATNEAISINATPEVSTTTYKVISGDINNLIGGKNTIVVRATAQDNTYNDYTIYIIRNPYTDNNLINLQVTSGQEQYTLTPEFSPTTDSYNLNVDENIENLKLTAIANKDKRAIIANSSATYEENINMLISNPYNKVISVTSEDGNVHNYTLNITRTKASDNTLKSLTIENNTLNETFDANTVNYTLNTYDDNLNITAIANSKYAVVSISKPETLVKGNNTITIYVTSEAGVLKQYTIIANRVLSDDAKLKELKVSTGLNETFAPDTLTYTSTTHDASATISAIVNQKNAKFKILDSSDAEVKSDTILPLNVGTNVYKVIVTSEANTSLSYQISINRILNSDYGISNISLTNETLSPVFSSDVTSYIVNTDTLATSFEVTMSDKDYGTYKIFDSDNNEVGNNITFNKGENKDVTYVVRGYAEDKNVYKDYTITIHRISHTDPSIANISFENENLTPTFNKDTYTYDLNTTAHSLKLSNITMSDSIQGTYKIFDSSNNEASLDINFTKGANTTSSYIVRGYAEDISKTQDYTININRSMSNNTNIKTFGDNLTLTKNGDNYTANCDETKLDLSGLVLEDDWASYTVEGNENFTSIGTIYPVKIVVTSEDGTTKSYQIDVTRLLSTDSKLKNISFDNDISITPEFKEDVNSYSVYIDNTITSLPIHLITKKDTANITSIKVNDTEVLSSSSRQFDGNISLPSYDKDTSRTIVITTLAEDGKSSSTYTLNILSTDFLNNYLASLQLSYQQDGTNKEAVLSPTFNKDTLDYTISLENNVTSFAISAFPEVTSSTVTNGNYTFTYQNNEKEVKVTITVTSRNNETRSYNLTINRKLDSESRINSLAFKDTSISINNFDKDTFTYDVDVPNSVSSLSITDFNYTLLSSYAKASMATCKLTSSKVNTCTIFGIAEDGTRSNYVLNVTREKGTEARLKSLKFGDYLYDEGDFDPDIKSYHLRIPKTKTTIGRSDLTYELMDSEATISFPNNMTIDFNSHDNVYVITVTASDGLTKERYIINVEHILSTNNNILSYTIGTNTVTVSDDVNSSLSPNIDYSIFDDETTATLNNIVLQNEDGMHNANLPMELVINKTYPITVTAEAGQTKVYTFSLKQTKTKKNSLTGLTATVDKKYDCEGICTLDSAFAINDNEYNMTVPFDVSSINISVTKESELETYEIIGNENFKTGNNDVIVRVYNSLNDYKDYTIHVTKEPSHEANVKNIGFKTPEKSIDNFDPNNYEYYAEFSALESGKYTLDITKSDEGESYVIEGAQVLYFGMNNITVHTYSESCYSSVKSRYGCSEQKYLIHAYRYEKWSNLLNSLVISSGSTGNLLNDFNKYKFDYVLPISSDISNIKVSGIASASDVNGTYHATVYGNGDYTLGLGKNTIKLVVTPEDGGEAKTYTVNVIRSVSDNVNLESLAVTGYQISPTFSKNVVEYNLTVDSTVNKLPIVYTPEDPNSTVYINGNNNFITGSNTVSLVVLSPDQKRGKTYRIHVTKLPSNNNLLNNLTATSIKDKIQIVDTLKPNFDSATNEYTINVDKYVNNITFAATPQNSAATISGASTYSLNYGVNNIPITVTSESGLVNVYNVVVNREYNLNLASLSVKNNDTDEELLTNFDNDTKEYTIEVPYTTNKVNVTGELDEQADTVNGLDLYNLNTGNNDIKINVTYDDSNTESDPTSQYVIHINRKKNNDSKLLSLNVSEGVISPVFDANTHKYAVSIPYEYDKITPTYTFSDSLNGHAEVLNNSGLEVNVPKDITIRSYAEDNTYTDYVITVTRTNLSRSSNYLSNLYLEEATFDQTFSSQTLNYSTEVERLQLKVTLHVLPESIYSTIKVYNIKQPDNVVTLNTTIADPNTLLQLDYGENIYIIGVTNEDGLTRNYQARIYRIGASEARIKSLTFDNGTMSPNFDKNNQSYTINVDNNVKKLNIAGITMVDPNSTYTISGNDKLNTGVNTVKIVTKAQDGSTTLTYTFNVNRKQSDNAYLSSIATFPEYNADDWNFDKEKYQYTLYIDKDVEQVQVIGIREDTSASIKGNGIFKITSDQTKTDLVVTSESGLVTRTYTINIVRNKDSNNYLKSLTTNNGTLTPEFNKDTESYSIEVDNTVDAITLQGVPEKSTSLVTGNVNSAALNVGENNFAISVAAEDGTIRTYTVKVNRKEAAATKTQLDSLSVKEGELSPAFAPLTNNYVVEIPNEYTEATINYVAHDSSAIVKINGNSNFIVGHNNVEIIVNDGTNINTYNLDIIRQEESNTYLKDLAINSYAITPTFDKNTLEYNLIVPYAIKTLNIKALTELTSSKLYLKQNNGEYAVSTGYDTLNLNTGENIFLYKVVSSSNTNRIYKVIVNRAVSDDNQLLTFSSSTGTMNQKFDPTIKDYEIVVPEGTKNIEFSGTYSQDATQTGLNTNYSVSLGSITKYVTITSQSGKVNTYSFKVIRNASTNANITNIVPSTGTLDPKFDINTKQYNMAVEGSISSINFNVTTEDANATVTGNSNLTLSEGNNNIEIVITAEDGVTKNKYNIVVYRKINIKGITIDDVIDVPIGEQYPLVVSYIPENTDYKSVTYKSSDTSIFTIDTTGNITPVKLGTATLDVTSSNNSSVTKKVTINVIQPKILTDTYYINRDKEYISGFEPKVTIADFISNIKNDKSQIKVYDKNNVELSDTSIVATKQVIKLEINNKVYDQLTLILKGDIDGNGKILTNDSTKIKSYVLKKATFDDIEIAAADIDCNNRILTNDSTKVKSYVLKKATTLNTSVLAKVGQ